jgi:hypothetical protein
MLVSLFINQYPNLGCSLALFGNQPLLGIGQCLSYQYKQKINFKSGLTSRLVKKHKCLRIGMHYLNSLLSVLTDLQSKSEPKETAD